MLNVSTTCDALYSESHPFECDRSPNHEGNHEDHHNDSPSIVAWLNIPSTVNMDKCKCSDTMCDPCFSVVIKAGCDDAARIYSPRTELNYFTSVPNGGTPLIATLPL